MNFFKKYILAILILLFISACADKQGELYNKPAFFWYKQILKDIRNLDLEAADSHYTSMSSEHVASPLLEEILLILATAHIEDEEYLLANFYLDEYIKKYGTSKKNEYVKFLKIKANFLSFSRPNRDQKLLLDTIKETRKYLKLYPNSRYLPLVQTILVKMELGDFYLNKSIEELYRRTGRDESADVYKNLVKQSPLKDAKLVPPDLPWYMDIFE